MFGKVEYCQRIDHLIGLVRAGDADAAVVELVQLRGHLENAIQAVHEDIAGEPNEALVKATDTMIEAIEAFSKRTAAMIRLSFTRASESPRQPGQFDGLIERLRYGARPRRLIDAAEQPRPC